MVLFINLFITFFKIRKLFPIYGTLKKSYFDFHHRKNNYQDLLWHPNLVNRLLKILTFFNGIL